MNDFFETTFYGNTVSNWFISLLIIIGSVIIGKLVMWFFNKVVKKMAARTKSKLDDLLVDTLDDPAILLVVIFGFWIAFQRLTFSAQIDGWINKGFYFIVILGLTWLIARVIDALIANYLEPLARKSENDLDDQLIPIFRKSIRSIIWILGVIIALNNTGFDVGAILAGLGIGGLALAMAAKDLVSNIFGGFTVFTDKPFKINDRIKIGGFDGTVIEIGIRTTRIRTLEGRVVTIPNANFTGSMVENVSMEPNRKVVLNLGMVYDTSDEQMMLAMDLLRNIVKSHPHTEENIYVGFNNFGDFSLGIILVYYITKGEDILQAQTDINLEILKQFSAQKLGFAYPTQRILTQSI